jgi:hypothetical protein
MALGIAFATALFAGRVSVAAAKFDEGAGGSDLTAATNPHPAVGSGGWAFEGADLLMTGVGAFVLVLGLGLAFGHLRRPRLAGL